MPGHRIPGGSRAPRTAATARHHAAARPRPVGPALSTSVLAGAAAVGAVATGTFSALVPTAGVATVADAAEAGPAAVTPGLAERFDAALAASGTAIAYDSETTFVTALVPVVHSFGADDAMALADRHVAAADKAGQIIAEIHAREAAEQAERERIAALIAQGGLDGWIAEALQILDLPQSLAPAVRNIIMKESGGNPRAINNWDANARRGTPSQGLMQTIPSTYRAYVHPEVADRPITDPVANITAGIRYMIATYGMETLAAGGRTNSSGGYIGY